MKALLLSFFFTFCLQAAEVCKIDFPNYKFGSTNDCVACEGKIQEPGEKSANLMGSFVNFVTNDKEQVATIHRLKVLDHFLSQKFNEKRCSNFKTLALEFNKEFLGYVKDCEKGSTAMNKEKICKWVLPKYNTKVTDTFYAYWSDIDKNGKPKLKPGKYKKHLEGPIRNQEAWCRMVEKNYKNKIYIGCGDLKEWVDEFNITKKVSESMKKAREEAKQDSNTTEELREKMLDGACKYFDNHSATTFTKDLYLECLTR